MTANRALVLWAISTVGLIWVRPVTAQESEHKIQMKDLPPAVQKAANEQAKGGTIRGLATETENGKTYYEVELTVDGRGKDVLIDAAGNVVEVEQELDLGSLTPAVRAGLEQLAAGGKLVKIESVTSGNTVAYEAVVEKDGKKSEIKVGADGKPIPPSK